MNSKPIGVAYADPNFDELYINGVQITASPDDINKLRNAGAVVASGTPATVIADPTGGVTEDAESRAAIASIIDALQAFGIVATS